MKRRTTARSSSLFLMELIIAILFFSVAASICVQFFVKARLMSQEAAQLDAAVAGGAVSREMADRARADAAAVMARFAGRGGALETLCRGYLEALLPQT